MEHCVCAWLCVVLGQCVDTGTGAWDLHTCMCVCMSSRTEGHIATSGRAWQTSVTQPKCIGAWDGTMWMQHGFVAPSLSIATTQRWLYSFERTSSSGWSKDSHHHTLCLSSSIGWCENPVGSEVSTHKATLQAYITPLPRIQGIKIYTTFFYTQRKGR